VRVTPGRDALFDAEVADVGPDGALLVSTADGRIIPLASAEITLRAK
jgi:biotin-(acetyl-CoA carboxylase) ligase